MVADFRELAASVNELMAPYSGTWALCGGWAVDAWLGRVTREHEDIDVAVFLDEQDLVFKQLAPTWRLAAHETDDADHDDPWDGHPLAFPSHLHSGKNVLPKRQLHVNERGEGGWILRRTPTTALPRARFAVQTAVGLPVMAPEALAFYKQSQPRRPRDEHDLAIFRPLLDQSQRVWLNVVTRPTP